MNRDLHIVGGDVDVVIRGGVLAAGAPADGSPEVDASGCIVVPGFIDLQCNGGGGIDLTAEPERLWELAALLPRFGVTAWLPTIVTSPPDRIDRALATLAARPAELGPIAEPLGLHLEGPFLNPIRRGAHEPALLANPLADVGRTAGWSRPAGVALVTLAPELPGALDLVRGLAERGVIVAAGHTDASADQLDEAVRSGITMVTHLFNGMNPLHHRAPGVPGTALLDGRLRAGVIADGVHVAPAMVDLAWRLLGDRLVLVTDAVAPMGTARADGRGVRLADGTLAGADLAMDAAVRNLTAFTGSELTAATSAASAAPAAVLGDSSRGHLRPGGRGDVVVLRPDGTVAVTVVHGVVAHTAG